jgi:hypothetical protein
MTRSPAAPNATHAPASRPGFALLSVILALTVTSVLLAAFSAASRLELASVRATSDAATGFFSAEAGLNIRGERIRAVFQGYSRPSGASPDPADACAAGNVGSGHFACQSFQLNRRDVTTYVLEDPRNNDPDDAERMLTIPPGERFAGLNAIQYRYSVVSEAVPVADPRPEAVLEMVFRTRLVPLFQFAAFYDKDLEILPGPDMTLGGPVHVNGDLYLNGNNTLTINGAITVGELEGGGGGLWRGRKNTNECTGTVRVNDADASTNPDPAIPCGTGRRRVPQSELDAWNGRIETGLERLTVPSAEEFAPGGRYWQEADLIVALDLRSGPGAAQVIVPNRIFSGGAAGITANPMLTTTLNTCVGTAPRSYNIRNPSPAGVLPALPGTQRAVEWSNSFRDRRENGDATQRNAYRVMLEVDVRALLNCMHNNASLFDDGPSTERTLNDTSGGGLVWYLTVLGPFAGSASSGYGVRVRNGASLSSTIPGAPRIRGLTVVTDQAAFIEGDYNVDGAMGSNWRPAAFLADALNILSNNFAAQFVSHNGSVTAATTTTVQAAFLSGTRTTGNQDGTAGQGGAYNGGLENYPIFHENWSNRTLQYRGSFVSLEESKRSAGAWNCCGQYYHPPIRDWGYEVRFNNAANLPPLSPRFVYLLQERFVREFTR